jgi:hypothetical protein
MEDGGGWYAPPLVCLPGEAADGVRDSLRCGAGIRPLKAAPGIGVTVDRCG